MKFSHTLKTGSSPEKIWVIWTDVDRWSEWDTELYSASIEGNFKLGAKGKLVPKTGPTSIFKITQYCQGESYTFTIKLPLCNLIVSRYLSTNLDGNYFTHGVSFEGFLGFLFGFILGRRFRSVLPSVMENIKRIAEE
jgi:hypothetical protein